MKKVLLSGFVVALFVFYGIYKQHETSELPATTPKTNTSTTDTTTQTTNTTPVTTTSTGTYKNGEYTGSAADAFYGNIQVKAIINGGKITDVQFLQYPNDQDESRQINAIAMPQLTSEAIQAQNANVDIVSRATDSSLAFRQSLQSALDQAAQ